MTKDQLEYASDRDELFEELTSFLNIEEVLVDKANDNQPVLRQQVAELANDAYRDFLEAKAYFKRTAPQLRMQAKKKLDDAGEKYTDKSLDAIVESHVDLINAEQEMIEAEVRLRKWEDLKASFDDRRKAIDNKVKMITSGYISYK
jgi:hypothetical protein